MAAAARAPAAAHQRARILALVVLLSAQLAAAPATAASSGNSSSLQGRAPRVTGRIVKLYAHARRDAFRCGSAGAGFHADSDNCAVFYRCVESGRGKFTTFKFQCSPGTVYDPETGICNFPSGTRRVECGGNLQLPSPSTESHSENDIDSNWPDQPPPSPISTKKTIPEKPTEKTTPRTESKTATALWTSQQHKQTPAQPKPALTSRPTIQQNSRDSYNDKCTADGFMGDSKNCKKFYRCVANGRGGFIRYEFSCSDLTIWDDNIQACNHAWAAKSQRCGRGEINVDNAKATKTVSHTTDQLQNQSNYGEKISQKRTQSNNDHPVDQNRYQINNGSNRSQSLNQINKLIDVISQSQKPFEAPITQIQTQRNDIKQGNPTQTQQNQQPSSTTSTQDYYDSNAYQHNNEYETTSITPSGSTEVMNNDKCTSSGFMGDSKDCKKFYRCVDNGKGSYTRYEFSCGEGTVWDVNTEACNHAWAVKECGGKSKGDDNNIEQTTTRHTTTTKRSTTSKPITQATTQNIEDYDQGYGQHIQKSTPKQTNIPTTTTTQPEKTSIKTSNNKDTKCVSSGFMGDPMDCKTFYRCVDNGKGSFTRYEFSCGEGTVWDTKAESCNHAWAVKDCGRNSQDDVNKVEHTSKGDDPTTLKTTTPYNTESNLEGDGSGYDQHQDEMQEPHISTTTKHTTLTEKNKTSSDRCSSSGFMGDSHDCKKFFRCVDNGQGGFIQYEFSCGEGTVWDQGIEACNHAWAVKECEMQPTTENNKGTQSTQSSAFEPSTQSTKSPSVETTVETEDYDQGYGPPKPIMTTSTSTTVRISEGSSTAQCSKNGFMGDDKDCKKFYRCVENGRGGFIKYEFSCGEGTVWDSEIDACNHQNSVKRPCSEEPQYVDTNTESITTVKQYTTDQPLHLTQLTQTEKVEIEETTKQETKPSNICNNEGFVGDVNDCKKFHRCVDNGKGGFTNYEFMCGDGTVWDQDIQACNHEAMVKNCGVSTSTPSGIGSESQGPDHDEPQEVTTASKATEQSMSPEVTTDSIKSPPNDGKCLREGFYPDSNDCKKFHRCVDNGRGGYTKYDFTCGEGTIWDQEIEACNHQNGNTKCSNGSSQTIQPTTPSHQDQSSTNKQEESTSNKEDVTSLSTTRKPDHSSGECTSEGFYQDENDCKKFYRCVDNGKGGLTKYEFSCGDGTVWDQEIQGCNFESNVNNCRQGSQSSSITQQPQTSKSPEHQTTERLGDEYVTPEQDNKETTSQKPNSGHDGQCSSEGFHANEVNCKKFYRCVDDGRGGYTKYDFDCGEGTAWDQEAQTCNYEGSVNCESAIQNDSHPSNDEQQSGNSEKPGAETGIAESTTSENPHPESNEHDNTTHKSPSSNGKCDQEGYFGNPNDCKKFYRCVDNGKGGYSKYDFDCGEGTIWDQDLTTCNHPGDVRNPSCSNGVSQSSTTSSASQSTEGSVSSGTTESSSNGKEPSPSTSNPESSSNSGSYNVTCPEAGFYPNPDDCKKFYRCVDYEGDGKSYTVFHFDCGEGTIWDPSLDTCNYEDSIQPPRDCSKKTQEQEVEQSKEPESTTSSSSETDSTTHKSTTQEQTTVQSEQTTQKETTTQKTTTQKQTTTQKATTHEQTTKQSTTQKATTQEQTTKQSTTAKQTTEMQTTQKSTTQNSTTQEESSTEQQAPTEQTTSQESTTTEQATTQSSTSQQETTKQETTTQQQSTTSQQETTTQESTTKQETTTTEQEPTTQESTTTQGTTTQQQTSTQSETTESQTEQGTTQQQTESSTDSESQQSTTEQSESTESSSSKECPETEDDQNLYVCPTGFRRHPKYCNLFYQCTEDDNNHDIKVAVFHCQNNTIYDESKTQCVEENKADNKCDGEMAERRRFRRLDDNSKPPISVTKSSLRCPAEGHFPFDRKDNCSPAFLKCHRPYATHNMRGFIYRCPDGFVYWAVSRRCERVSKMSECNRDDKSWTGRWEIPIETLNVAP